jgi:hypothetical protein
MSEKIRPIKPEEILDKKIATIPDNMIRAVNELIALKWNGYSAIIKKEELFDKYFDIIKKPDDRANREKLIENRALDFEFAYRKEGWLVDYSSPTYGDSDFEPYFTFTLKK